MDWLPIVSLTVGVISIILAGVAMVISTLNYERTKDVLSEISEKAAVIEGTVSDTQTKLVDTVTAIAKPNEETPEEKILQAMLPSMIQNPDLLERLIKMSDGKG